MEKILHIDKYMEITEYNNYVVFSSPPALPLIHFYLQLEGDFIWGAQIVMQDILSLLIKISQKWNTPQYIFANKWID